MWRAPNGISGGELAPRSDDLTLPRSYLEVDSIEDALAATKAHGGAVLVNKQPIGDGGSWAPIADPDGNSFGLYEGATLPET